MNYLPYRKSTLDEEMLKKESLIKVLEWATLEGRIHLLEHLVEPDMRFLWSRPQEQLVTRIQSNQASRSIFINIK